jgi:hypothetical protein
MGTMITVGSTTYKVEEAECNNGRLDTYFLTGPRGGVVIACPFVNDNDKYHGFRFSGTHADLKDGNGQLVTWSRQELALAAMEDALASDGSVA